MVVLNVVTALSRPANIPAILASLESVAEVPDISVRWLVVYDTPSQSEWLPKGLREATASKIIKVVPLAWTRGPCRFGINQKNYGLDNTERGYYHLLDDDNIIHPEFFKKLAEVIKANPGKMAFGFNQRRWDQHGDLPCSPDRMWPGKIDNTMFVVHTDFIGSKRYDLSKAGIEDGYFFHELHNQDRSAWVFPNEYVTYYNYLTHHKAPSAGPSLDIFVITYRSENYLPALLSDLGSMSKLGGRVEVVDNTGNKQTLTALWNDLWKKSSAEYIAILNPDIRLSPGWDERLLYCLKSRPDVGVAMGNRYFHLSGPPNAASMSKVAMELSNQPAFSDLGRHLEGFYAFMTKRSVLEKLKGFDERFRFYYADSDFQLRALDVLGLKTTQVNHCPIVHYGAVSTSAAEKNGELDRNAEYAHVEVVKSGLAQRKLKAWHVLSEEDRQAVRKDPVYGGLPLVGAKSKEDRMKLVIEDIYSAQGRRALVEAYTKSMWADKIHHKTIWCGVPSLQVPEDLLMLSELIWVLRPKLVVECGIWHGGGLLFYSSIMELIGQGEVIGVDVDISRALAVKRHPLGKRITLVQGSSADPDLVKMIAPKMSGGNVIVILDSNHEAAHVRGELAQFAPLIPKGSYLIVLDGIMKILHDVPGGEASWKTNNPDTALQEFLKAHPEFEVDQNCNKFGMTCGPGGFLRRK